MRWSSCGSMVRCLSEEIKYDPVDESMKFVAAAGDSGF